MKKLFFIFMIAFFTLSFNSKVYACSECIEKNSIIELDLLDYVAQSYISCPKCHNGKINGNKITLQDGEVRYGDCLNYCKYPNEKHFLRWYYDVFIVECDSCSYKERSVVKQDYGWYCSKY